MALFVWIAGLIEGSRPEFQLGYVALVAVFATPGFAIGLTFPGVPIWLWLHAAGYRSRTTAMLAVVVGASVAGVVLTAHAGGWAALLSPVWMALPGAAAGWTIWRIVYGPLQAAEAAGNSEA